MNIDIVTKTHQFLLKNKLRLAVAESCTGGLISKLLTDLPGSSRYFILGVVAYNNSIKRKILKVPAAVIAKHGTVSAETARCMAQAVRRISGADIGVGVTGIAGPSGGSTAKPVGTVFIAISRKDNSICRKFRFTGTRDAIRKKAALNVYESIHSD